MDDVVARTGSVLYETDFYAWTQQQAGLLRSGRVSAVDLPNILEELENLGRKEVSELRSRFKQLALHLLKELYQPERARRSWRTTILNQRIEVAEHIADSPSLKSKADDLFTEAYGAARLLTASETALPLETFPCDLPFSRQQALSMDYQPWLEGTLSDDDSPSPTG